MHDLQNSPSPQDRTIADALPDPMWTADAEGCVGWYNRRWYEYTGMPRREGLHGGEWAEYCHPDDLHAACEAWENALAAGRPFEFAFRLRGAAGGYRRFLVRAMPIADPAADANRWLAVGTDVDVHADLARTEAEGRALRIARSFERLAPERVTLRVPGLRFDEFYAPAGFDAHVGGDWYDAFRVRDGRVVLSIGDVPGFGLPATATMAAVRQVIRGVASVNPEPVVILDAVERVLEGGAGHDAPFVTAWVGVLDPLDLTLRYASAGHPAPLLRAPNLEVAPLPNGDPPLGLGTRVKRHLHAVRLEPKAALLLYTDGLIEADRDVIRGERAVKDAFVALDGVATARTIRDMTLAGRAASDDVALLLVNVDRAIAAEDGLHRWRFDARDALEGQRTRHDFTAALRRLGYAPGAVLDAELAFGELLGNVVRHAPGPVEIRLDPTGAEAVLHVLDRGHGFQHNAKLPEEALSEHGRGLFLIDAAVDDLAVSRREPHGAHVRAVLRRQAPAVRGVRAAGRRAAS